MNDLYKKQTEAYVDNEMSSEQKQRIEETLKVFPTLNEYAQKVQNQNELLKRWWKDNQKNRH